jgi:hypothetical protein
LPGLSIYEIDLSTGANRQLGVGAIPLCMAYCLVLSHDGTKLAFVNLAANLKSQAYVLNITNGKVSKLGEPRDASCLSWLDDGQGLVLLVREWVTLHQQSQERVVGMDLAGRETIIAKGDSPMLVPGGGRLSSSRTKSGRHATWMATTSRSTPGA